MSGPGAAGSGGGSPPGGIDCEEALARVYEYLDGELAPELQERIHAHLEVCRRCYPVFDFERLFLDHVREKGLEEPADEGFRRELEMLLEEVR